MKEKYLPIGTVVLLKGGRKRAMITGFCSVAQENQEKIYDYSGSVYPEGYLSSNQVCLFDHDQIDKIFFLGYEDEEEVAFKDKLNKIVASIEEASVEEEVTAPVGATPITPFAGN
ncbi:MAG: DUF4176 domain-containing protein [Bacilli bacterium]|nr:DUF4176 domain-containing protein [Bacilli bacterium]